jgi:ATP-dependent RNA helicase DeaD
VENEQDVGVSRGQNQLHLLPEEWQLAAAAIAPLLDRIEVSTSSTQLLIITNDSEAAAGMAARLGSAAAPPVGGGPRVLAATDARRASRVLRAASAHVVAGPPAALVELVQASVLKLDNVRAVVLAWAEDLGASPTRALETLMAELPKDAARIVIASAMSPAVEQLVERYARRARKAQPTNEEALAPASLSYVTVHEGGRLRALRRVLDAVDPESGFVVVRSPDARESVASLLRSLGYGHGSDIVRVGETPDAPVQLMVLFELPTGENELRALVQGHPASRVVALVTARQIAALRRFAGGAVAPLVLPEAAARARSREESLRDELRAILSTGHFSRELIALEPLLSDHDGVEVAAAALRLLDTERAKPHGAGGGGAPQSVAPPMTRLYLNVGSMDNVRPGDLVGAITSEAGISKGEMGKVDVRERHSTVEVATTVANSVVSKITGVSIRNRRVLARVDDGPPERPARPRRDDVRLGAREPGGGGGRDRGGPPRDRGSRPPRPNRDRPRRGDA